jgi:hypothetical protein
MQYMHPDEDEHRRIDELMGGEESESLHTMHVFMGKRYLGCDENAYGPMMMNFGGNTDSGGMVGMMGAPFQMMTGSFNPFNYASTMPSTYFGYGLFQVITWILAILGIVWLVEKLISKKK